MIWTLCEPDIEFQRVNPTTQVALASECAGTCTSLRNITWHVYHGTDELLVELHHVDTVQSDGYLSEHLVLWYDNIL